MKKEKVNKTRELLVDEYLKVLEQENIPFEKDWISVVPKNAVTQKPYRSLNRMLLAIMQKSKGYEDPRWCTFNQAASKEWFVKKDEKSIPLEYYFYYNTVTKKSMTLQEFREYSYCINMDRSLTNEQKAAIIKQFVFSSSSFHVFNVSQLEHRHYIKDDQEYVKASEYYKLIDNIKRNKSLSKEEKQEHTNELKQRYVLVKEDIPKMQYPKIPLDCKIEKVFKTLIKNMGVSYDERGNEAYYNILLDQVVLPPSHLFKSLYGYYSSKLHELCHATGHESRLNRNINARDLKSYAQEELRAEIGASFLMGELGLQADVTQLQNHKAYVQGWAKRIREDPKYLFDAIKDADNIVAYIKEKGEFEKELTTENNKETDYEAEI